ncbi:alpha/beta fold hydrolase [Amycolatopsis suaedae]|uniref:alpha/beta fold hydrolase n=1 Tax=Amycolatopsis suaedae TaxID=2510978 RepID=UPI00196B5DF0|nr:alpha/beta hydrolase [Amycolatopsis suaedae]
MLRTVKASAIALSCVVAGVGLAGCDEAEAFTGTRKLTVEGKSVNVSCSGSPVEDRPVIVLLHGGGDSLDKLAGIQQTLSATERVCSYDRLGAGASDQPGEPQTFDSTGRILTGVLDQIAADTPVVLAGHSLGGLIAGRYAPDHQDRVAGLVLLDATSPTQGADLDKTIPASATGLGAELKAQTVAVLRGENPERLAAPDGDVRPAGDIPVEVIQHGKPHLGVVPEYGPALERAWSEGQEKWRGLSSRSNLSTAANSGHYIYVDEPDLAVAAIRRVADQS